MPTLVTGAKRLKAGVEYSSVGFKGNAIIMTEDVRISVNHSPMAMFFKGETVFAPLDYVFMFEHDTVIKASQEITPDFDVITNAQSSADVALTTLEILDIVTVSDPKEITSGSVAALCYVQSLSNQAQTVTLRIYGSVQGLIHTSIPVTIPANSLGTNVYTHVDVITPLVLAAGEIMSFSAQGSIATGLTIIASTKPSQMELTRSNL